ncbi:nucleoside triphosphate pyrophosphohydrolase [Cytobacillus sp. FSL R7-0680]|uniref:nucleoside triphosphate pyrophosphohydrolase n=1 Tax=Cytobacillus sp. FSL R7-0680 TaxID=2921689 RepID=UPI0030FCE868
MPTYNKLVRDRIPDIIQKSGKLYNTRILSHSEYTMALKRKLQEEVNEYLQARHLKDQGEELADILEVVYALSEAQQMSADELDAIRRTKAQQRGRFESRVLLIDVQE